MKAAKRGEWVVDASITKLVAMFYRRKSNRLSLRRPAGRRIRAGLTTLARRGHQAAVLQRLTEMACRRAFLVLGIWVAIVGGLNIAVPQLEHVVAENPERSSPNRPRR